MNIHNFIAKMELENKKTYFGWIKTTINRKHSICSDVCVSVCNTNTHTPGHNRTFALAATADIWDAINILFSQFYKNMFYTPSSRRQPCMIMHNIYIDIQTSTHHPLSCIHTYTDSYWHAIWQQHSSWHGQTPTIFHGKLSNDNEHMFVR